MAPNAKAIIPLVLVFSGLLGSCADAEPPGSQPSTTEPSGNDPSGSPISGAEPPVPHTSALTVHMGEHFWRMAEAQDAAIEGNLEGLQAASLWLAEHDAAADLPEEAGPFLEVLRTKSFRAAEASDLMTAGVALGEAAAACGTCHRALDVPLPTIVDQDLTPGSDLQARMSAHIRAADLMWEALIAPSDAAWTVGAYLLTQVDIPAEEVTEGPDEASLVSELLVRVSRIAQASTTATAEDRPALYGQLVSTCGSCHSALGRGFRPGR